MKKTLISLILIAAAIALVLLIVPVPQEENVEVLNETYSFTTTNNIFGSLTYLDQNYDTMTLEFDKNFYNLKRGVSASGTYYVNEDKTVSYREHQGEASVEINGQMHLAHDIKKADLLSFHIEPHRADCVGVGPMKCLVVNGELFYDTIADFDYEEGTTYDIKVLRTKRENVPADASSYMYRKHGVVMQSDFDDHSSQDCDANSGNCNLNADTGNVEDIHYDELTLHQWQWKETQYPEGELVSAKQPSQFTAQFGTDGKFSSTTDCNTIFGEYTSDDGSLFFDHIGATEMACMGEIQEQSYATMIGAAKGYAITSEGNLLIRLVPENTTMVFTPVMTMKSSVGSASSGTEE